MKSNKLGNFVISLDFELYWGVSDSKSLKDYLDNLENVEKIIKKTLKIFSDYSIEATWAYVGFLNFESIDELRRFVSKIKKYNYTKGIKNNYDLLHFFSRKQSKYLFLPKIIDLINESKGQELGCHNFSHLFSNNEGISIKDFNTDIDLFIKRSNEKKYDKPKSYIFPRNEINEKHLGVLREKGFKTFRGTESSNIFKNNSLFSRVTRVLDTVINLSGDNIYDLKFSKNGLLNIPSSRFLRPITKYKLINKLRLYRIVNGMRKAAELGKVYHLWWHPHNFGNDVDGNIHNLSLILKEYEKLKINKGFKSMNMLNLKNNNE